MFHRNKNNHPSSSSTRKSGGFFHRQPAYVGNPQGFYRDPYYEGSTRSDWDHYAVRHEEALIGDPLPIMHSGLNMASHGYSSGPVGPYGPGPLGQGPLNHGYDDSHYNKRHPVPNNFDKFGNPLIGPVTANGPLAGNYSSGTVVERNYLQGPGRRSRTIIDESNGRGWGSSAWGSEPLYGSQGGGWGSQPLFGYRESRMDGRATPLLPDNPWTHNELGRDWSDGYRRGTIPYSSINNAYVSQPVTESFTTYGPNGELIEGTRTRVIREEIVPTMGGKALGTQTTVVDTKIIKDEPRIASTIPIVHSASHEVLTVQPGVAVTDRVTTLPNGQTVVSETRQPVTVVKEQFV